MLIIIITTKRAITAVLNERQKVQFKTAFILRSKETKSSFKEERAENGTQFKLNLIIS